MKKIGFLLICIFISVGFASAQGSSSVTPNAEFKSRTHDFGKIAEEIGKATCVFEFKNTGSTPLIVNSVRASCGCTTPSYTKDPVLPGETGEIKVAYSTSNRVGKFNKSITVFTNVPDTTYKLIITGEVLPKKK